MAIIIIAVTGLWTAASARAGSPPQATAEELEPCQLAPEEGRLWRITGFGGPDSFLLATVHLDDPRVLDLPATVRAALAASDTLVLEALYDEDDERGLREAMRNPLGIRLSDLLQPTLFERVRLILGQAGYPESAVQLYKPWAAALLVAYPRRGRSPFLDRRLYLDARAGGKRTLGLETLAEQVAVFDGLPPEEQIALLAEAVEQRHSQEEALERIVSTYLRGDLPALLRDYRDQAKSGERKILHRKLVEERNHVMIRRLLPLLREGGVFVAVGALHLPGEEGLLALLRRQGAVLRRVTMSE